MAKSTEAASSIFSRCSAERKARNIQERLKICQYVFSSGSDSRDGDGMWALRMLGAKYVEFAFKQQNDRDRKILFEGPLSFLKLRSVARRQNTGII